jgi:hypothetical protein
MIAALLLVGLVCAAGAIAAVICGVGDQMQDPDSPFMAEWRDRW